MRLARCTAASIAHLIDQAIQACTVNPTIWIFQPYFGVLLRVLLCSYIAEMIIAMELNPSVSCGS